MVSPGGRTAAKFKKRMETPMQKRTFSTELAYVFGMIVLALGTALMEKADMGVSMVVAPAYLVYLKLSEVLPFFTFGMAEYMLQFVLLIALSILQRRVRLRYVLSFGTAVLYGFILDGLMALIAPLPVSLPFRIGEYVVGMIACAVGVSLLFHTYFPPEAYELFVQEVAPMVYRPVHQFKTTYDCVSCAAAVVMSFVFFGFGVFRGVKWGTVLCALVNGTLIGLCTRFFEKRFDFSDKLPLRGFFEK